MRGSTFEIAYVPLSLSGPSTSIPIVRPSFENEWQLAQVGSPVSSSRLADSPTFRSRHATSRTASGASGLITPSFVRDGISGTSR